VTGWIGQPGSAGEWNGGVATQRATCVLAPNPGPMTLDGTNTWLIAEPGSGRVGIIDPGPDDPAHWEQVKAVVDRLDLRIDTILLTHGHHDHSAGARLFASHAGCSVRALDPAHRLGSEGLADGEVVEIGGAEIRIVATPGHSGDSLSMLLVGDRAILTGDTILGRGTTVVAYPDGRLADYLDSLARLEVLVAEFQLTSILPGHGPTLDDPTAVIEAYIAHRQERLEQIRTALASLDVAVQDRPALAQTLVETVYADVPKVVWPAALVSVYAQLEYLLG